MALLALLFVSLVLFSFSTKNTTQSQAQCLPNERHALIQLKQGFKTIELPFAKTNTTKLHSWNASTDCCKWDGITCDEKTGMVTALDLSQMLITGILNPALFNLSALRYLNLAYNYFDNLILPQTGFERLANLTHLDLFDSGFAGQVPSSISALTNLISLKLSYNNFYLHDTGLKTLLSNLTKLQVLGLDDVNISLDVSKWGEAVLQVAPTLQVLSMGGCELRGNVPDEIFHLTNLTELDLHDNFELSGQLPEFMKQSFLQSLFLANANFTSPLPDSIGNLQYLLEIDLYNCNIYGEVPPSITNLTRLHSIDLGSNRLTGTIPMSLFSHPSLEYLYLSQNQLSRILPEFSNGSSNMVEIELHQNNFQGPLPISIFKSSKLFWVLLESNNFNGTLNLDVIKHNKKLGCLNLSNNKLSIIEGKNHNESFYASFPQLEYLGLASCNLEDFPHFLSSQTNIETLDLSKNSLMGEIPLSICNMTSLTVLDLSYNNLTSTIPPCLLNYGKLRELNLRSNKLSGPLPQNISQACGLHAINLSENVINGSLTNFLMYCNFLVMLDLGNNRILDRFPYWLGNLENLRVLVIRSNMFYGEILDVRIKTKGNYSFFPMLKILDLSSNHFSGALPKNIFVNLKAIVDASNTSLLNYPYFDDMNASYITDNVASVTYKGQSIDLLFSQGILSYIDLSNNEFSGRLPKEVGCLKALDVLNLSHNALTGSIPLEFAHLHELQSLDLSSNQLSGHIPQELTSLTFLSELNLSYNNLVGEIPEARQFSTFTNDSYLGNPGLCGSPLSMQCAAAPSNDGFDKGLPSKSSTDIIGFSVSIGLGLGVGFAFVIWATISWENGRKWFNFIIDRFYIRHFH